MTPRTDLPAETQQASTFATRRAQAEVAEAARIARGEPAVDPRHRGTFKAGFESEQPLLIIRTTSA